MSAREPAVAGAPVNSPAPEAAAGAQVRAAAQPPSLGSYEYEMKSGDRSSKETRAVKDGGAPDRRWVDSPSGTRELLRWSDNGVELLETLKGGSSERRCVWDRPILVVPLRDANLSNEATCTMHDRDTRTVIRRTDNITSVRTAAGIRIKYSTEEHFQSFVDSPTWKGGDLPGNRMTWSGEHEWSLTVGLSEVGSVTVADDYSDNRATASFKLIRPE